MYKIIVTIATLFAYSGMFSQTWNTGTGAWISPLSKNIGIQKSLQVGDNLGTDSLWCKTDLNYFEGNVGIGTTTPEAKLHVSISDTLGSDIAHFENNIDNAIITVHTHSDSSALYLLQTEDFNAVYGLVGTTGEVIITTGLAAQAIQIDTNANVTIPDLAGSAQKLVTADAAGTLDTVSVASISPWSAEQTYIFPTDTNMVVLIGMDTPIVDIGTRGIQARGFHLIRSEDNTGSFTMSSNNVAVTIDSTGGNIGSFQIITNYQNIASSRYNEINMGQTGGGDASFDLGIKAEVGMLSGFTMRETSLAITGPRIDLTSNLYSTGDLVITDSAKGLVLKDNAGTPHYWRVTISTLGVLTTTDLGTTPP